MHLYFERNITAKSDCPVLTLAWMGMSRSDNLRESQEGWLAIGNARGMVSITFTASHARTTDQPSRTNYNLRGHKAGVILVKWNEPHQKLASCDSSGMIQVWIKYEGRWTVELINDRSTPVTHFSWSPDGRMALICYQDGFVLVGSVAGQRYWSSMLSLDAHITCGCWTPDNKQVYLGTASAQLVVMDAHGAMVSQVQLVAEGGIRSMAWSCKSPNSEDESDEENEGYLLAVSLENGEIVLLRGHDDVSPVRINTGLRGDTVAMEWADTMQLLAVAGTLADPRDDLSNTPPFKNVVKFFSETGVLIYTVLIPHTEARVSSLTWGHGGRRLFVGVGTAVCTARVWHVVAPLQLLAQVRAAQALTDPRLASKLPLPSVLQPDMSNFFTLTIRSSVPEPQEIRRFVLRPPFTNVRIQCTMLRHDDDENCAYTLYLEHLGGLIPLLKGRRISKIRHEFVIFDRQDAVKGIVSPGEVRASSSTSSSSSGTGSSSSGGTQSPRAPFSPRPARRVAYVQAFTSSSDTEREEGCSGSPRMQRRKRARQRRKARIAAEKEDTPPSDLAYIDSLPEDDHLLEITSNVWGTRYKLHGLAKDIPANLGQIMYKTSLLHLQPRQMSLMIADLRHDCPLGPDPNFNPHVFSEDEEDFQSSDNNDSASHTNNNIRKNLNERMTNTNNINQNENTTFNNNNNSKGPTLARAESYDEFDVGSNDIINNIPESVCSTPLRHQTQPTERRVSNTSGVPNRHAISPLRCENSVPTLQSPKNAVAPTDIIFERPSPQTVSCGGRGDFCRGRTDYGIRGDNVSLKGNISNLEQSFSLKLSMEPGRQVTIKKCDNHITDNCLSKLRKNICSRGEPASYDMNTRILKALCNKGYEQEVQQDAPSKRGDASKQPQKAVCMDEENPADIINVNLPATSTERGRERRVQRTTTVVPISPMCATVPVYDSMTRSCSVGYLDLVAPPDRAAPPPDPPRKPTLPNNKRHRKLRRHARTELKQAENGKTPRLNGCGKTRSLDSNETSPTGEGSERWPRTETVAPKAGSTSANSGERRTGGENDSGPAGEESTRRSRRDYPVCTRCRLVSPNDRRAPADARRYVCAACAPPPARSPAPPPPDPPRAVSDYSKYYSSLEQLALRLLASRSSRSAARTPAGGGGGGGERASSSAPPSPHPSRSHHGSPTPAASPAREPRTPRRQRFSSASPIRQLLNSPLLNRRRNKKPSESSDEEISSTYSEVINSINYKDLESFQKAKLRNKLIRAGTMSAATTTSGSPETRSGITRRQLLMHNKAPLWNESSQVYQLDFGGRVSIESAKNFQVEYLGKPVMQFGRINDNTYSLDYQVPFTALQAFAVALANVTQRLK